MVVKINTTNFYKEISIRLKNAGYDVRRYKEISYGLQFKAVKNNEEHLIRVFYSKKKGMTFDTSQIKNSKVKTRIETIASALIDKYNSKLKPKNISEGYNIESLDSVENVISYLEEKEALRKEPELSYVKGIYKIEGLTITIYEKKLMVQGKSLKADIINQSIASLLDGGDILDNDSDRLACNRDNGKTIDSDSAEKTSAYNKTVSDDDFESKTSGIIGIDESGKGDFYGPLVVAAVHVDKESKEVLKRCGVCDSKILKDAEIKKLAKIIKKECSYKIINVPDELYNRLYSKFKNLNDMLGWGHAEALECVLEKVNCDYALADKFGKDSYIKNSLKEKGKKIKLVQKTKAESNIAVAAASILARNEYVSSMNKLSDKYDIYLPKGGSSKKIISNGKEFIKKYGIDRMNKVAKLHFKTLKKIRQGRLFKVN